MSTNPHNVFINFSPEMIAGGILVQPQIIATKLTLANDEIYQASDYNIKFVKYGFTEWRYFGQNFFLVPGEWTFEIFDGQNLLSNLLFYDNAVEKNIFIQLSVNRGTGYNVEYSGNIEPVFTSYEGSIFKITAKAIARTDIINNIMLFDTAGKATNPLGYGPNRNVAVTQIIQDIYKFANPSINVVFSNDWSFQGIASLQNLVNGVPTGSPYNDFQFAFFSGIFVSTNDIFYNNLLGLSTLGDVLRALAFEFGAITGMIDNSTAFFKSIYSVASSSKAITSSNLLDYTKRFIDYPKVYAQLTMPDGSILVVGARTLVANRSITRNIYYQPPYIPAGQTAYTGHYYFISPNQSMDTIPAYAPYIVNFVAGTYLSGLVYSDYPNFLAQYWLRYFASQQNSEVHRFRIVGTDADFNSNFTYNLGVFQPVGMKRDWDSNVTEIDTILLS